MALDANIRGVTSGTGAEVAGTNQLKIIPETNAAVNGANVGGVRVFSEVDQGLAWGQGTSAPLLLSPEVSAEFRTRVEHDTILDEETFDYTAQNFTKHSMAATTFAPTWSATGFQTNPSSLLTAGAATSLRTYKTFSVVGTETLSFDIEGAFSWASGTTLPAGQVIEIGGGLCATATPYDWFDGAYMRLTNTGAYFAIRNNSGTDTYISGLLLSPDGLGTTVWQPVNNRVYQFIIYVGARSAQLWISDPTTGYTWLAGNANAPTGYGAILGAPSAQVNIRHYQATAPTISGNFRLARYSVRRGGQIIASSLGEFQARACESIYSPGTLTTTANQTITTGSITRPTAAAPTNTAALVTSLSGIVLETPTGAAATDTILMAFQNPALPTAAGATYAQQRRLRIDGVSIASAVQTALTGGGIAKHFYLAYGSTSVSLAGVATDTVTTKADRRVQLPLAQAYTATQAAGTLPSGDFSRYISFKNPIYVNPGEFVKFVTHNLIGTAVTAGTIQHAISFDYTWE